MQQDKFGHRVPPKQGVDGPPPTDAAQMERRLSMRGPSRASLARLLLTPAAIGMAVCVSGCDLSGHGPARLRRTVRPAMAARMERAGHAYCMRGFLGIFSTGITRLAGQLRRDAGVSAASCADSEVGKLYHFLRRQYARGRLTGPLILIGHSWGADDQIRIARRLGRHGIAVRLLVLIDPVTPPRIPPNVKRCMDIYKSHPMTDWLPFWRGVPVQAADPRRTAVTNINLRYARVGFPTGGINHINIESNPGVHRMVIAAVKRVCPTVAGSAGNGNRPGRATDRSPGMGQVASSPKSRS